jgi:hypothetical protein
MKDGMSLAGGETVTALPIDCRIIIADDVEANACLRQRVLPAEGPALLVASVDDHRVDSTRP